MLLRLLALIPLAFAPLFLQSAPPAGDDDDDDDEPPVPPVTGNAAADSAMRSYHEETTKWRRRVNKRAAGHRVRAKTAEEKLAQIEGRVAPEGAVVLQGDDKAAYEAYTALGTPADLQRQISEAETALGELATLKRDATIREVAEVAGYRPGVLARLGGDLEYVVKDVPGQDGKPATKQVFVKVDGGEKPLAEYAGAQWADFLPALKANGTGQAGGTGQGVTYVPPMGGGGGQPTKQQLEERIRQQMVGSGRYDI